jgi:ATP-dependent RNA helicase DHX37/DHR1
LVEAEHSLKALKALDNHGKITPLGKAMAQYPMSPRHSRLLLTIIKNLKSQQGFARPNFILGYAAAAASALSSPNPFLMQNEFSCEPKEHNPDSYDQDQQERKRHKKKLKAMVRDSHAKFINPSSDALTIAHALRLFELSGNTVEFCRSNSLHLKTMEEMSKLRKQLLRLIFHHSKSCEEFSWNFGGYEDVEEAWRSESDKNPMQLIEEEILGEGVCAGWADRVAKRIGTLCASSKDARKVQAVRYQSCALSDTIYLHQSSSVAQISPDFVVYSELINKNRPWMYGVTSVKPSWLLKYASSLCTFSAPLKDQEMFYDRKKDQVYCFVRPIFSQHNWQLPLHRLPVKDGSVRSKVFACAWLKGDVLPCLKEAREFLSLSPSAVLGPVIHRKVGDLVCRMKSGQKLIDSRAALRDVWNRSPEFLCPEIKACFQDKFHSQFGALWRKMHWEIRLEGEDLFPKRSKKIDGLAVSSIL